MTPSKSPTKPPLECRTGVRAPQRRGGGERGSGGAGPTVCRWSACGAAPVEDVLHPGGGPAVGGREVSRALATARSALGRWLCSAPWLAHREDSVTRPRRRPPSRSGAWQDSPGLGPDKTPWCNSASGRRLGDRPGAVGPPPAVRDRAGSGETITWSCSWWVVRPGRPVGKRGGDLPGDVLVDHALRPGRQPHTGSSAQLITKDMARRCHSWATALSRSSMARRRAPMPTWTG